MNAITTTHRLDFESAPWPRNESIQMFKVGTCHGQWYSTQFAYHILSIINDEPGNGHLNDVFEWFENSCRRDGKVLIVEEIMNGRFGRHLCEKRGFIRVEGDRAIKVVE